MELMPIRRKRRMVGAAAVLLPMQSGGAVDWDAFVSLIERTVAAGLIPAVNMDTGYVQLLSADDQARVLRLTSEVTDRFFAGVCVVDSPGDPFDRGAYDRRFAAVADGGATPVIFPSWGLNALPGAAWVSAQADIASGHDFVGFELGEAFVPYGRIVELEQYAELMEVPNCIGAKHSSLSRISEWERLRLRDQRRPDFSVFTGNDLAIDMVTYGSDYLLGLAAAAPDVFAIRDAMWAEGDPRFYEVNDLLQYLGAFAFRPPVPAYKHSLARVLEMRGWIPSSNTHPASPARDPDELTALADIATRLDDWASGTNP